MRLGGWSTWIVLIAASLATGCGAGEGEAGGDSGTAPPREGGSEAGDSSVAPGDAAISCESGPACPSGSACTLTGGSPGICCSGVCTDTSNDPANCGGCGTAVPFGHVCSGGLFVYPPAASCAAAPAGAACPAGDGGTGVCCAGQCRSAAAFAADPYNCGSCGNTCLTSQTCSGGQCTGSCPLVQTCPPGYVANGCACTLEGSSCTESTQGLPCAVSGMPSGTCCGSSCADLLDDPANCGACGHACAAGAFCDLGVCRAGVTCTPATANAPCGLATGFAGRCCGGACVDPSSDQSNCGACGFSCASPTSCVGAQCALPGATSLGQCTSPGQPGYFACPSGTKCEQGPFGYGCVATGGCAAAGEFACDNGSGDPSVCCAAGADGCHDFQRDPANCGGCGVVCPSGVCIAGSCFPVPRCADCSSEGGCPAGTACTAGYCVAVASACSDGDNGRPLCATSGGSLGICCTVMESHPYCADPLNDPSNCGGCGITCASCVDGKCQGDGGQ